MKYVKKSAQVLLVDDSEVNKYTEQGFLVFVPGEPDPTSNDPEISSLFKRVKALKLKLPDGLTVQQVREAVEQAEKEKTEKETADAAETQVPATEPEVGVEDGKDGK